MATKKVVQEGGVVEDYLGLVAFGSLITNIVQIVHGQTLENKHEALKKYAFELKHRYIETINRNKKISAEYLSLKKINEGLIQQVRALDDIATGLRSENTRLKMEMDTIREENLTLKSFKTEGVVKKKRRVKKGE